jgi:REP element-mobilizing transposase RayT
MPRQARIDAPGALHHIILRGIEKKPIFKDQHDYANFRKRLGKILTETATPCFAWALMTNHVHLLLRTGLYPITTVMRRLLTGYAQQFNRRHKRHGHLFQNRYKSYLCEEEPYLLELVRYIHLNPIRAGMVEDLKSLAKYNKSGHAAILGKYKHSWQDVEFVLRHFGKTMGAARRSYTAYVTKGIGQRRRPELVGGGLIRSFGGWSALKASRYSGLRIMGDERILGSGEFVESVLKRAKEDYEKKIKAQVKGFDLDTLIERISGYFEIDAELIKSTAKQRQASRARSLLCYLAVSRLKVSNAEIAHKLNVAPSTVSKCIYRGQSDELAKKIEKNLFDW